MWRYRSVITSELTGGQRGGIRANFEKIESRQWWLWAVAFTITVSLTLGLASVLFPSAPSVEGDFYGRMIGPQAIWALIALVLLFYLYALYHHFLIHKIRKQTLEREELFALISENAVDMIAIVDMRGRRLFNSLSYEKVLGYTTDELHSSSAFDQIHPDDRKLVEQATEEARASGTGKTLDYRFRHKNGSWMVLESTSSVTRNPSGEPDKLVIVNRDVTEQRRAGEALRRSEADFRSVVERAPYGICRATVAGRFVQANPALQQMLGYETPSDLLPRNLAADIFGDEEAFHRFTQALTGTAGVKDLEIRWKRKDGMPIDVRCSGVHVAAKNDSEAYLQIFVEDVTEKRSLERQLRTAQKMEAIGRLSGGIAHDFNNLLGVIIGYSRVLRKSLGDENPLCEHVVEIEKAGERAASLTKQLLAFSRQQILTPSVLNLNALISDLHKMLPQLLGEDIHLVLDLNESLGNVKADQSQLEQVVMNLAVNARDAMPQGGQLTIRTANVQLDESYTANHPGSKEGSYVLLSVSDTGTGMDSATLARIFEPFFTTKQRGKGTGLGLATVYGIVKQSNGYIWAESALQQGSSFQIYLPRFEEAPVTRESCAVTVALRGSERILLVEDAEPLRRLVQALLLAAGFQVVSAATGEEALRIAEDANDNFDLLLTDVVMPGINGRALAEQLLRKRPGLRVLYMSGYTDTVMEGDGGSEREMRVLQKPFSEETLVRTIRDVLDSTNQLGQSQIVPHE